MRIALLSLNGRAIAVGTVLQSGARAFFWKTAFDPAFARFSPGVQLTLAMSRSLEADRNLALVDSCADPNHSMIDRIWTPRIDLADFVLEANRDTAFALPLGIAARRAKTSGVMRSRGSSTPGGRGGVLTSGGAPRRLKPAILADNFPLRKSETWYSSCGAAAAKPRGFLICKVAFCNAQAGYAGGRDIGARGICRRGR